MRLLFLLLLPFAVRAQSVKTDTVGNITVTRDSRYDLLVRKQAEYNEKVNLTRKFSHGFRIQVLNTGDRNQATAVKTKLLQTFPQEKVYLFYQEPNFKVRFGNFRTQNDAEEFLKKIDQLYPGSFVIPSPIEPKPEWFREASDL
ncbi:MAG TPA: SPOR domain-containing protein [bacterium]|jgi:hypothetical protein|nr:SPOR domain-containing protein [bacterium]